MYQVNLAVFLILAFKVVNSSATCSLSIAQGSDVKGIKQDIIDDSLTFNWLYSKDKGALSVYLNLPSAQAGDTDLYMAFGLSEVGHMVGSDIATIQVSKSGKFSVVDRYVLWDAYPIETGDAELVPKKDKIQNWDLDCATLDSNGFTAVITRSLTTDDPYDRKIEEETAVIFAYGSTSDDVPLYHGTNREHVYMDFTSSEQSSTFTAPKDADSNLEVNFSPAGQMKAITTQYICQIIELTDTSERHIVAIESSYQTTSGAPYVHHILLHGCGSSLDDLKGQGLKQDEPFPCQEAAATDEGSSPLGSEHCNEIFFVSASGTGGFTLPENAGFLVGGSNAKYLVIEAHLDNEDGSTGDEVGNMVKIHFASVKRDHDAAVLLIGDPAVTLTPDIDPDTSDAHFETTCPSDCTNLLSGNLNVFASFLHMHKYGKTAWTARYYFEVSVQLST